MAVTSPKDERNGRMPKAVSKITIGALTCGAVAAALWGLRATFPPAAGPSPTDCAETRADRPAPPAPGPSPIQFQEVTRASGITFVHTDGSSGRHYIPETVTCGLATLDFDGDGLIDLYFPNGAPLPGTPARPQPRHALYRNLGDGCFGEVTDAARVAATGYGLGATVADYDNDGFPDLYVSMFGPKVLYHNGGDGTFSAATATAGVADGNRLGAGVAFLDIDRDGNLDLFVANYVKFTYPAHVAFQQGPYLEYAGPKVYPPDRHSLFHSRGDGTFADVTEASGIAAHPGKGMGVVCADYDHDGDTDIFVLNDVFENFCFQNDGTGRFREVGLEIGFKYNGEGLPLGSMGVDCADYDNDGHLDFFQTSYQNELPVLFRNLGTGVLEDATLRAGAGPTTVNNVKWGCALADLDNDGHRDLLIGMGHLQDEIDRYDSRSTYRTKNVVLRNDGRGKFVDVSAACGIRATEPHSARGIVCDDLDNDGDLDAVILNSREVPTVLRNQLQESSARPHWLQLRLIGVRTNRDGVGARVQVTAGDLMQTDEVHSGRGYQGHFGSRLHFGLGPRSRVSRIEVQWLGGETEVWENMPGDRLITLTEGTADRVTK